MSQLNDIALIAQVLVWHNNRAFDRLVRKHQSAVRRFLCHLTLGDKPLADDLAQDTFIRAYERLSTFKNLSNFQTWLFKIAYNIFYDYLRSRKASVCANVHEAENLVQPPAHNADTQADINAALQVLREDERTCITLQLIEDQSVESIAVITGMPSGTVKSHLARGKEKLANYLKQNGYDRGR